MHKQVLLRQKNSGKTRSDASGKWIRCLPNSILNGTVPSPVAFTGRLQIQYANFEQTYGAPILSLRILPCDSHSPLFCQPQSCLPLLVISISKLCTHLQTYLNLSILILYLPISVLVPPACPAYPLPPVLLLSATLQHTFYLEPADIPQHTYQ